MVRVTCENREARPPLYDFFFGNQRVASAARGTFQFLLGGVQVQSYMTKRHLARHTRTALEASWSSPKLFERRGCTPLLAFHGFDQRPTSLKFKVGMPNTSN